MRKIIIILVIIFLLILVFNNRKELFINPEEIEINVSLPTRYMSNDLRCMPKIPNYIKNNRYNNNEVYKYIYKERCLNSCNKE